MWQKLDFLHPERSLFFDIHATVAILKVLRFKCKCFVHCDYTCECGWTFRDWFFLFWNLFLRFVSGTHVGKACMMAYLRPSDKELLLGGAVDEKLWLRSNFWNSRHEEETPAKRLQKFLLLPQAVAREFIYFCRVCLILPGWKLMFSKIHFVHIVPFDQYAVVRLISLSFDVTFCSNMSCATCWPFRVKWPRAPEENWNQSSKSQWKGNIVLTRRSVRRNLATLFGNTSQDVD